VPLWVAVLRIPYPVLITLVLGLCVVGVYSLSNSVFDIGLMLMFGVVGYVMKKIDLPTAPLVLTFVIGPLMERGLRQSLEMSQGEFAILWTRPLSATLLAVAGLIVVTSAFRAFSVVRGADSEV
jgi:putative tricarboxylic transport membrane protein